jgi:hypothetical protein
MARADLVGTAGRPTRGHDDGVVGRPASRGFRKGATEAKALPAFLDAVQRATVES